MKKESIDNELVRYSRAGDVFHYLWAARRCLKMIDPKSAVNLIVIEGSKENKRAGEYVIDVAEYLKTNDNKSEEIYYYQLKHTTKRKEQTLNLAELKNTIVGFAERYRSEFLRKKKTRKSSSVYFTLVTNRTINNRLKNYIQSIIINEKLTKGIILNTLTKYTKLKGKPLIAFCSLLRFVDGEGDYNQQRYELHKEISMFLAGTTNTPQIDTIVQLIQEKALPDSDGHIIKEDILKRFGVTHERDLFPAPPEFENLSNVILREQHKNILDKILNAHKPVIIHAAGGVGKTVFARQLITSLPDGSLGIVYDCFGGGKYRNRSATRHRHRDGLIQIINDMAINGLCDPVIAQTATEDEILRKFLSRIHTSVESLRKTNKKAILAILIDAADNAEMAAKEFNQSCFVHEILKEEIPEGCKLVALCRTERINLLLPSSNISLIELKPFSESETLDYLKNIIPEATGSDAKEFHRLTDGNPRVQANALSIDSKSIEKVLITLGPSGKTVEGQISMQLNTAIEKIKESLPVDFHGHVDAICIGLATLPPFIPIIVLAKAAGVDIEAVKSFVADLGRPLWISDTSVHFRDEPTETWFRKTFSASKELFIKYILYLKPIAHQYSYVAETLPSLLLQAEQYDELINTALSDEFLPEDNPIDKRNIRIYRLQFAFRAALKLKRYSDSIKLALQAGEEVAGNKRQLELLKDNVDLIAPLLSEQRVQELAFRRILSGEWEGSENVYSAALLASVNNFNGEARSYLRAAENWLRMYFEERKRNKEFYHKDVLSDDQILLLVFSHFNLFGAYEAVKFILSWRPPEVIFRITMYFIRQLIDAGKFDIISQFSTAGKSNKYLIIATVHELIKVGKFVNAGNMRYTLTMLAKDKENNTTDNHYEEDNFHLAVLSFLEACAVKGLSKDKILATLSIYFPEKANKVLSSDYIGRERERYIRAVVLNSALTNNFKQNITELLPEKAPENKNVYEYEQEIKELKTVLGGLMPWYMLRIRALLNSIGDIIKEAKTTDDISKDAIRERWRENDSLPTEISRLCIEILLFYKTTDKKQIIQFFDEYIKENKQLLLKDRLNSVRMASHSDHLMNIRTQLEQNTYEIVLTSTNETPEDKAEWYIKLSRAVLPVSREDAAIYFNLAIESVSKLGDEIVQRWEAVVALAKRCNDGEHSTPEIAYRFIRCAELVGDYVAREKYWDRYEAIKVLSKLSPTSAFAVLSRWRDRDVGWFESLLPILATEMVSNHYISPTAGWSLAVFFGSEGVDDFALLCMEKESSKSNCKYILETAIRDLRFKDVIEKSWWRLKDYIDKKSISNIELEEIAKYFSANPQIKETEENQYSSSIYIERSNKINWNKIFDGLDLTTTKGIKEAINRLKDKSENIIITEFWKELFIRISGSDVLKFLRALIVVENISLYETRDALSLIPTGWHNKISIRMNWEGIIKDIAKKYADGLANRYTLQYFIENIGELHCSPDIIHIGIIEGLANSNDLEEASLFFGFVECATKYVSIQESTILLDFALKRFELHIESDFADGEWRDALIPPNDIVTAFSGFLWAALGSPRSEIRWKASHCVRKLAATGCRKEIEELINWMEKDEVGAFGHPNYPFYNLHARQYLLIALARISLETPDLLRQHNEKFVKYTLSSMPHIIIQKYSAEIALNVLKYFPDSYGADKLEELSSIGKSIIPVSNKKEFKTDFQNQNDNTQFPKYYHGWDFERYWFEPLGGVFGISSKQVENYVTDVIFNEWRINVDGSYKSDPRNILWRLRRYERETNHSHGSYPRTDGYSFYLSYHGMLVVASKLLKKFPVIQRFGWGEDEWHEWFKRHLITRSDGKWLSDRRDPPPLARRAWVYEKRIDNWDTDISEKDFLDGLLIERNGKTWLNIFGWWDDVVDDRKETFLISSALVAPEVSQSLLNALSNCSNPNKYKLPEFNEQNMEFDFPPFELKGWVWRRDADNRLDEYDPIAAQINYPPYQIGKSIIEKMKLFSDSENRTWFVNGNNEASIICDLWSSEKPEYNEDILRKGNRMTASLDFLKSLSKNMQREIIIEVQLERRFSRKSYRNDNENESKQTHSKIYILSSDGRLRDERTSYKFR